ncbi:MAG TPA: PDZ domain-containing protein [Planctomycetota bacterium]|nr:PDZ domain-containing protein [Planctomycetota bacterium]
MARIAVALALIASLSSLARAADGTYESQDDGPPMGGFEMSPTTLSKQAEAGLGMDEGVQIRQVFPGTAANEAGMLAGDVLIAVNGAPITSMTDVRNEVGFNNVGDPVRFTVVRNGQRIDMAGTFKKWPDNIPREPLDPAVEQRFKDWQRRHLERNQRDVAQLREQLQALKDELANPRGAADDVAAAPRPDRAMAEAAAFLKALPSWKLEFAVGIDADAIPAAAGTAEAPVVAQADVVASDPWRIDVRLGTGQH